MSMVNRGRIVFSFMKLSEKNLIIRLKIIFGSNRFFTFQIDEIRFERTSVFMQCSKEVASSHD